jgi:hypothetical protein
MGIAYYRDVKSTDEGCDLSQCLQCGAMWEWRGTQYVEAHFCMFCGCKFVNKLACRESYTPRWLWDYKQRHGDAAFHKMESTYWDVLTRNHHKSKKVWVIEERTVWLCEDGSVDLIVHDWRRHFSLDWAKTARDALKSINDVRLIQTTDPRNRSCTEYRLRLCEPV